MKLGERWENFKGQVKTTKDKEKIMTRWTELLLLYLLEEGESQCGKENEKS